MFRNVPECSGMFHVPGFIDALLSANCRYDLPLFRLCRCDCSGMDKSSSATCLFYSDVVKAEPSPTKLRKYQEENEEEAVTKKAIKEIEIFVS